MVDFLKPVIKEKGASLSNDERNLLSVAFKNLISSQRSGIRTISSIQQNSKYEKYASVLQTYKTKIEENLFSNCDSIIAIIKNDVLTKAEEAEAKAFFLKMIGDYCRYIAENAKGDRLEKCKEEALSSYKSSTELAISDLGACNAIRLGLALNFSVFHYEVLSDVKKAVELGEKALQDALDALDDCDEETFRNAQSIIELLKENLSLWKEEDGQVDDL